MLTETTLLELRDLVSSSAPAERRAELLQSLDDLQRAIAAQALLVRNLTADLRNRRIGQEAMDAITPAGAIDALIARLGEPRRTTFSIADARAACDALADEASRAADVVQIAAAVARVVRVFV
jgi:hypothetical protein